MIQIIIIIFLILILISAIVMTIRKFRRGGGCCGEHEAEIRIKRNKISRKEYPFRTELRIHGMTCINCARRVESALNELDGIQARVDLSSGKAKIFSKQPADETLLYSVIAKAGYTAGK